MLTVMSTWQSCQNLPGRFGMSRFNSIVAAIIHSWYSFSGQ
jgi:hypothetical protein